MEGPEVSVVMAVYNGLPYLEKSVRSILTQTFEDFEYIIINDGSEDGSRKVLEHFAEKDERVRLVHQENRGHVKSLNRGLKLAQGRYVARMDADDISYPKRLERQVEFMEANQHVGVAGTRISVIDEEGEEIEQWAPPTEPGFVAWRLLFNACFTHPSILARRSLLEKLGGYASWAESAGDHELWTRAIQVSQLATVPYTLLKFRRSKDSITATKRAEQMQVNCKAAENLHRALLGASTDESIAHFLVWLYQFGLDRAVEETGVNNFEMVYEYLGRLYRAHRERFGSQGTNIRVRREVLPKRDLMAAKIAEEKGVGVKLWYKIRARLMRPTYEVFPWLWRSAREKLMPAT